MRNERLISSRVGRNSSFRPGVLKGHQDTIRIGIGAVYLESSLTPGGPSERHEMFPVGRGYVLGPGRPLGTQSRSLDTSCTGVQVSRLRDCLHRSEVPGE